MTDDRAEWDRIIVNIPFLLVAIVSLFHAQKGYDMDTEFPLECVHQINNDVRIHFSLCRFISHHLHRSRYYVAR